MHRPLVKRIAKTDGSQTLVRAHFVATTVAAVAFATLVANATEPTRPARLAESPGTKAIGAPLEMLLLSDTVQDISVRTSIRGQNGRIVSDPLPVGIAIVKELTPAVVAVGEAAVARAGDTVEIASPHAVTLAPGLYEELIHLSVTDSRLDYPVEDIYARLVEVTDSGTRTLSAKEYSERVERKVTELDTDRRLKTFVVGALGPALTAEALSSRQAAVLVESGDPNVRVEFSTSATMNENDVEAGR